MPFPYARSQFWVCWMRVASIPDRFTTTPSNRRLALVTPGAPAGPALIVGNIWVPSELQDGRIRYRVGSNEVGAYQFHRWSERPGTMISESLVRTLRASGKYRSVMESQQLGGRRLHPARQTLRVRRSRSRDHSHQHLATGGSRGYEEQAGGLGRSRAARGARPQQERPGGSGFSRSESADSHKPNSRGVEPVPGAPTLIHSSFFFEISMHPHTAVDQLLEIPPPKSHPGEVIRLVDRTVDKGRCDVVELRSPRRPGGSLYEALAGAPNDLCLPVSTG